MAIEPLLQVLRRRGVLLTIGLALAIVIALKVGGGLGETRGLAQGQVLLDTKRSQLIDVRPVLVGTLPWRASLLGKLLGTGPSRARIANAAGIRPDELAIDDSQLSVPSVPASLPRIAAEAAEVSEPYVLAARSDGIIPVIAIKAQAPDPGGAARLADAAAVTLERIAEETDADFAVERVSAIESRTVVVPGDRKSIAAVAVSVFALWCAAVYLAPVAASALRSGGARSAPKPAD